MRTSSLLVIAALGLGACTSTPRAVEEGLSATEGATSAVGEQAPTHQVGAVDVVLDERPDGARLLGHVLPTPAGTDADRVLAVVFEDAGHAATLAGHAQVIDARFVGDWIALIEPTHTLLAIDPRGERETRVLDEGVEAPLAVRGEDLVYARGDMPFFELARADVSSGVVTALTEGWAPAYSPAIEEDGAVVFVSTREGRPRLHRVRRDGRVEALAPSVRTPSSPRAPTVERGRLRFEDERGTVTLDLASGQSLDEVAP